jgi:hypothetical protein
VLKSASGNLKRVRIEGGEGWRKFKVIRGYAVGAY